MKVLGIDPGTSTGFALWDSLELKFSRVTSYPVHVALREVETLAGTLPDLAVVFEDARRRQWFGRMDAQQAKYGASVREGAGAAKRDASIWEDFLLDLHIAYQARTPAAGCTKWTAQYFRNATKWEERTNEHGRDAGVLVFGMNTPMIRTLHLSWAQARTNANTPPSTSARR